MKIGPQDIKERKRIHKVLTKIIWLVSTARNILVVVFSAVLAYFFELHGSQPFILTGYIKPGLPEFKPPPFEAHIDNTTYNFVDMSSALGSGIIVVPLLSILENIALAKVFGKDPLSMLLTIIPWLVPADGKTIDATQEMLALGVCNIASSFVQSMPVSGALSRGAVNHASGVKTSFGGIYTGIIVILSLHLFTPYFSYIPKASLAAVIIAAVVFMVEFHVVKPMWRTKSKWDNRAEPKLTLVVPESDLIPACTTFVCCLFLRLEIGIVVGVGINLIFLLYATARPSVNVEKVSVRGFTGCMTHYDNNKIVGLLRLRLPPHHPRPKPDFPVSRVR